MPLRYHLTWLARKFKLLGPGFITGAADDDPSGIATYSIAGAQFGYKLTWLCLFLTPLMFAVQEMSARIGMCSGMGLSGAIKKFYSRKILISSIVLLIIANTINIGADLGFMAASLRMLLPLPFFFWLSVVTLITVGLEVFVPYNRYSRYLKWMGLSLLVYIVTAVVVKQDWKSVTLQTLIPHVEFNLAYLLTMVGFIGTTISPYLFFWQASEEVEEEIRAGRIDDFKSTPPVEKDDITKMQKDTIIGMSFSNVVAFFIVLTTAATLNVSGIIDIETPQQAAQALRPLAGDFAYILFTLGIIAIGLQSVPVLSGGVAYAIAEAFNFREGLSKKLSEAKAFYGIIVASMIIGATLNLLGINPIRALYYAAIINGVTSVPLIAVIVKLSNDPRVVGKYTTNRYVGFLGYITLLFLSLSSGIMIYMLFTRP